MSTLAVELDKRITSEAGENHGTISVRVVVLRPKKGDEADEDDEEGPADEEPDMGDVTAKSPLAPYLEKKAHGKWCTVFLMHGQRHHSWDNVFISRDLGFKLLRDRTMVIVDLDGLSIDAMSEIIQCSRQGLFEGKVYLAIRDRIIQTLKSDPDLKRLQMEAEQKALDLEAGDEAVKNKLDQLIEGHHASAHGNGPGTQDLGPVSTDGTHFGNGLSGQHVVVMGGAGQGEAATLPALVTCPHVSAVRLHPGQSKEVVIVAQPREEWANLEEFRAEVVSEDENLTGQMEQGSDRATVTVCFAATDYDDDDFPVHGTIQAYARFKGRPEPRTLTIPVVVTKKPTVVPPTPIELLDDPTFLRMRSRQPVRLIAGGPAVHVRMQWNGKPSLLRGSPPRWRFGGRCLSLGTFPRMGFGFMDDGRLEFILYPPHGLLTDTTLQFEVEANGPDGKQLRATFRAVVVPSTLPADAEPRKVLAQVPPAVGQRHPPYDLKDIREKDWKNSKLPCWKEGMEWTAGDAGSFIEPTETQPLLILVINQDMELLKTYREGMVKRKPPLDPGTIKERTNKYIAHVAFHLYQMYGEYKRRQKASAVDPEVRAPDEMEMRAEINRVGTTLMRLMEVSAR
jgi:hypothetical protein